ncbi:hypothetical protein ACIPC1_27875 [Streptomyces sp. NPDC087263]|uniref:hypothetical protein n=1 Tax=Streptomyces sp. NPDC087263 TaxID=3365773 RepID=UPI003802DCED
MTQSGQGEDPSPRPAREGIVLPSDGGAPLLPGTTGDRTIPAGGQAWDRPWGPEQQAAPDPQPDQGWGAPMNGTQTWGAAQPPSPDWGTPDASQGWAPPEPRPGWGDSPAQQRPLPDVPPGPGGYGDQELPGSQGAQQPQGFAPQSAPGAGPLPPEGASYGGAQAPSYGGASTPSYEGHHGVASYEGHHGVAAYGAAPPSPSSPLPSAAQPLPPEGVGGGMAAGAPLPPVADEGATQYIPHIPPASVGADGATQYIPHIPPAPAAHSAPSVPDEGATQFIPPVGPGALPPEVHAGAPQFLGRQSQGGTGPLPPAEYPDAQATQYIAPVPARPSGPSYGMSPGEPEDRQPPAEFDNLFRSEPEGPPGTQQLPRFDPSAPHGAQAPQGARAPYGAQAPGAYGAQAPGAPGAPGGRAAARRSGANDGGGGGRSGSRVPLIAAVGIGIAVLGIGAGAMLSSGGGDDSGDDSATVAATAPAAGGSASASTDTAKAQAVELDKLLADANASRDSVINAVADVTACRNLGQAASDLRDAAGQRGELVTRLDALTLDQLPNHAELTTQLTNGWKASESADNHYASWADQAAGKKGCKDDRAAGTGESQAGNKDSGTASAAKEKAAKLWNSIASTYGLTERTRTQL